MSDTKKTTGITVDAGDKKSDSKKEEAQKEAKTPVTPETKPEILSEEAKEAPFHSTEEANNERAALGTDSPLGAMENADAQHSVTNAEEDEAAAPNVSPIDPTREMVGRAIKQTDIEGQPAYGEAGFIVGDRIQVRQDRRLVDLTADEIKELPKPQERIDRDLKKQVEGEYNNTSVK